MAAGPQTPYHLRFIQHRALRRKVAAAKRPIKSRSGSELASFRYSTASRASPMKLLRARRPSRAGSPRANSSEAIRVAALYLPWRTWGPTEGHRQKPAHALLLQPAGALWARRKIDSLRRSEQGQRCALGNSDRWSRTCRYQARRRCTAYAAAAVSRPASKWDGILNNIAGLAVWIRLGRCPKSLSSTANDSGTQTPECRISQSSSTGWHHEHREQRT